MKRFGRYMQASLTGGTIRVSRLGRCPRTRQWCDSSCYAYYPRHASTWRTIVEVEHPIANKRTFLKALRDKLHSGENHAIDVEHLVGGGLANGGNAEWIDRGEDLDAPEAIDKWVRHLSRLLLLNRRLTLYGDTHKGKG